MWKPRCCWEMAKVCEEEATSLELLPFFIIQQRSCQNRILSLNYNFLFETIFLIKNIFFFLLSIRLSRHLKCQVRERSSRSVAMSRPSRSSLSASTPDSLSDNESSLGRAYTPRKSVAGVRWVLNDPSCRSVDEFIADLARKLSRSSGVFPSEITVNKPWGQRIYIKTLLITSFRLTT